MSIHINRKGVTITELMVAVAIMCIGILALIATFSTVHQSIENSKMKTLATNLVQEKMQILEQKPYLSVLVTQSLGTRSDVNPPVNYDTVYYPPENITEGGIAFTRYTYIQNVTDNSGVLQIVAPDSQDTGMKQLTVAAVWATQSGPAVLQLNSVFNNPNTVMGTCVIQGIVRDTTTLQGIPNAVVTIAENVGWRDSADGTGFYKIVMSPGNFNVVSYANGYFDYMAPVSIATNQTQTINLDMAPMSSGTIHGYAWMEKHLVISQVVAATDTVGGVGSNPNQDVEYIELYNPTTSTILMGVGDPSSGSYWGANYQTFIYYQGNSNNFLYDFLTYVSSQIPSNGYFLIANTPNPIHVGGTTRTPDAYYTPGNTYSTGVYAAPHHMIQTGGAGGIIIYNGNGEPIVDRMAWDGPGTPASSAVEGTVLHANTGLGIQAGEQFVRKTDTGTANPSYGNAYDSDNNFNDFVDTGILIFVPNTTTTGTRTPITGIPALGAVVSINDGLSAHSTVYASGSPIAGEFYVPRVATGTWNVFLATSGLVATISSATVTANTTVQAPNSLTTPAWPVANFSETVISSTATSGYIAGRITDVSGGVITNPTVNASAGGNSYPTNSFGRYFIPITAAACPGPGNAGLGGTYYDLTANPGNGNSQYVSFESSSVFVCLGQITDMNDIALSQGGKISGFVTRDGINALPGVIFTAQDSNGMTDDQEVSDNSGHFTLINLSTGVYTVQPSLDIGETSSPTTSTATVTAGATIFSSTFTITGDMGTIVGATTLSGAAIKTGVTIVASTATILSSPPAISSSTLTGAGYYATSSMEDGTYSLDVRGSTSTTYNVYGYYSTLNGQTVSFSTRSVTNVSVTPGLTTSGITAQYGASLNNGLPSRPGFSSSRAVCPA